MSDFLVRQARVHDAPQLDALLHEWLTWAPQSGRIRSIKYAVRDKEFLVAEAGSKIVGFIHFVLHEDVIDGAPNAFITAFYVQEASRDRGIGTKLLHRAVVESMKRGATFIETSTIHSGAKAFYEKRGFAQTVGDIGEVFLELDVSEYREAP